MRFPVAISVAILAQAACASERDCVSVILANRHLVAAEALAQARIVTTGLFDQIGVDIDWEQKSPGCTTVGIRFDGATQFGDHPGALAYAQPFLAGGARIHVLLPRVKAISPSAGNGVTLGYVMAHEIGHVLQRIIRHSDAGVMKACWNAHEMAQIANRHLAFAPEDAELIHDGFRSLLARQNEELRIAVSALSRPVNPLQPAQKPGQ